LANILIDLFQNILVVFFVNFLGFGVLSLIKIGAKFSFIERLVVGSLISNYIFMAFGIIFGVIFQSFLREFFIIYSAASLLVFVLYIFTHFKRRLRWHLPNVPYAPLIVFICFVQLLFILPALMHPIHNSYDYIYFFGPMVKETVKANAIPTDIPYTQIRGDFAPGILLTHVFSEMLISTSAFRLVSYSHFLLSLLVVYLIARNLFGDIELGIVAAAIMNLMPAVFTFFSSYSVYTEMSLMFYMISATWCIAMSFKTRKKIWCILAGMSVAMMLLSKNVGLYGIFMILAIAPLFVNSKKLKISFVLLTLTPILYRFGVNAFINSRISSFYLNLALVEIVPILIIGGICSYVSIKVSIREKTYPRFILLFLLFSGMGSIWYLRNLFVLGTPTFNLFSIPPLRQAEIFYKNIISVEQMYPPIQNTLRFDYILTFTYLGSLLIVPKSLGLLQIIRDTQKNSVDSIKKRNWMLAIFPLLSYLLLWLVIFYGTSDSTAIRNGILIIPFLSLITAYGLVTLFRKIKSELNLSQMLITLLLSIYIIETFRITLSRHLLLPAIIASEPTMSLYTLFWALLPPFAIFALGFVISKYLKKATFVVQRKSILKTARFLLLSIPIFTILFCSPLISYLSDLSKNNMNISDYQQNVLHIYSTWGEYDLHLIDYFQNKVNDTLVVVGFWTNGLYYFTGHRVFDPNEYPGVTDVYDLCVARNATKMLKLLKEKRIGYILIPLPNNPYYDRFVRFTHFSLFYNLALDNRYATRLGSFDMFELFKLKQREEKFFGMLDVRLVLSNDNKIESSPNILGNHGENVLPSYSIGKNQSAFIRVIVDLSGISAGSYSQFAINATAIIKDKNNGNTFYLTKSVILTSTNDTMKEIAFDPIIPKASLSRFEIEHIKMNITNTETNEVSSIEANPQNGGTTTFSCENEEWSIVQGSSYLQEHTYS